MILCALLPWGITVAFPAGAVETGAISVEEASLVEVLCSTEVEATAGVTAEEAWE